MTWNGRKNAAGPVAGFAPNLPAPEAIGHGYMRIGIVVAVAAETRFTDVDC